MLPKTSSVVKAIENGCIVVGGALKGAEAGLKPLLAMADALAHDLRAEYGNKILEGNRLKKFEKVAKNKPMYKTLQK